MKSKYRRRSLAHDVEYHTHDLNHTLFHYSQRPAGLSSIRVYEASKRRPNVSNAAARSSAFARMISFGHCIRLLSDA